MSEGDTSELVGNGRKIRGTSALTTGDLAREKRKSKFCKGIPWEGGENLNGQVTR